MSSKALEDLRETLNKLVANEDICLNDGEVLDISQRLDELIKNHMMIDGMKYRVNFCR